MMEFLLVLIFPVVAFLVVGLLGRRLGDFPSAIITVLASSLSFLFSLYAALQAIKNPVHVPLYTFILLQSKPLELGLLFDTLSSVVATLVTFVATFIFLYSIGYMRNLFGQWTYKFYAYLSFFLFSMLLIVLSDNLLLLFFGWEGVGLASYLLIGYFHEQRKATNAALEAFVMNRVGDWLFLLGILMSFITFGSIRYQEMWEKAHLVDPLMLSWACLLLFGGAVGKSGQVPLHTWLPNAMAGPTPVSALLHSSTMVAAGVYMVARLHPVFEASDTALKVIVLVGSVTALMAALAATSHTDIKKIIAFSTMSQLGLMFIALGLKDKLAGSFHLITHAFFKALLFLAAGSVIHTFHHKVHDIYEVGGLRNKMPVTYLSFMVGALALAGVFPFAGFWSKELILGRAYEASFGIGVLVSVVSVLTAYYIFREGFVMFHGEERKGGAHESEGVMILPMAVLMLGSVFAGFGVWWYGSLMGKEVHIHGDTVVLSLVIALVGIGVAYGVYVRRWLSAEELYRVLRPLHTTFREQFFTERFYHKTLAGGYLLWSKVMHQTVETLLIDGVVNGFYPLFRSVGGVINLLQRGKLNMYVLGIYAGLALLVLITILWR
ncbi:proton-translocating NADH-quinone oxidoreductase, chain L [Thermocrinis albus DSM 14484]|uniref:Proton-translocating NADH-quinone oxidoreductase, chain L n=2 Tax=Thermocrinis TaxID=75905 RepID=D3SM69_THEAH|nr:proton-translocating NADH-quinone oxidoreductase, chain L [Thermocrinis albus DSM 14484]